jgi:hypothetical protein
VHNKTKSLVAPDFNNETHLNLLQWLAQSRRDKTHAKTRINHAQAHKPRPTAQAGAREHLGNYDLGYLTIWKPACIKAGWLGLVDTLRKRQDAIRAIFLLCGICMYYFACFNRLKRFLAMAGNL